MNIINYYRDKIKNILLDEFTLKESDLENVSFELPKESSLGDLSTNASMVLTGKLKKSVILILILVPNIRQLTEF